MTLLSTTAMAASAEDEEIRQTLEPHVISIDASSGVAIIEDAAGSIVISGLLTPVVASAAEQQQQIAAIESARNTLVLQDQIAMATRANYYDTESNPILIGTWNGVNTYTRHTLGTYNSTLKYLTSYGDCSWYNTSGNSALPYRNGAATVSGQAVVDVTKGSYFDIRDLTTDTATTLKITDWGPDQKACPSRIADIDKNDFISLHGNSSAGLFYCRTWVPITNYNP